MADFLLLTLQHRAELSDGFFGVHGTRRIVRVVHDDGLRAFADAGFRGVDVELEVCGIRWDDGELPTEVCGVAAVLGEERGEGQNFVVRIEECAEDVVQAAGSTHGHDDVLGVIVGAVEAIQVFRDRSTHLRVACIGHVTVNVIRRFLCRDAYDGIAHLLRDRRGRVAEAEVVDVFTADACGELLSELEHLADRGVAGDQLLHTFRKCHIFLLCPRVAGGCDLCCPDRPGDAALRCQIGRATDFHHAYSLYSNASNA